MGLNGFTLKAIIHNSLVLEPIHSLKTTRLLRNVAWVFWGIFERGEVVLFCAHKQMKLATAESAIFHFSLTLSPSSGHHHSCQKYVLLQNIFFLLVAFCLHLGHWRPGVCGEWRGLKLQGVLDRRKELCLLLVTLFLKGIVSQSFGETALLAFTCSPSLLRSWAWEGFTRRQIQVLENILGPRHCWWL